jgi:autoinducer 2-degrading protein
MFVLFVSVKIRPEKRQRFLDAIEDDSICSVRDEPGCHRFDVLQDNNDPDHYYFHEVYDDEAAFQEHLKTPHLGRWREAAAECVIESSSIRSTCLFPRVYK